MTWCGIQGHDDVAERFRRSVKSNRLASTFLFIGPSGIGKRLFAFELAKALQCDTNAEVMLEACQTCSSCQQIDARSHPDVESYGKPVDRSFIPVDTFIGDKDHRRREGMCHWIGLKPAYGRRRIAIVDDADFLNQEGANCLLKTLEEPPPKSLVILIGTSLQRQLPTIRSRSQVVRFEPLPIAFVAEQLIKLGITDDAQTATQIARESHGSIDRAIEWSGAELVEFRTEIWKALAKPGVDSLWLAKHIAQFVEAAGKEAPSRRARLRNVVELFVNFYWTLMRASTGTEIDVDDDLFETISEASRHSGLGPESIIARIERCDEANDQISANANISTLIECWIDDLFACPILD